MCCLISLTLSPSYSYLHTHMHKHSLTCIHSNTLSRAHAQTLTCTHSNIYAYTWHLTVTCQDSGDFSRKKLHGAYPCIKAMAGHAISRNWICSEWRSSFFAAFPSTASTRPSWTLLRMPSPTPSPEVTAPSTSGKRTPQHQLHLQQHQQLLAQIDPRHLSQRHLGNRMQLENCRGHIIKTIFATKKASVV